MTKTVVLGEDSSEAKPKPIEFIRYLHIDDWDDNIKTAKFARSINRPDQYDCIELVCRNYFNCKNDLMFAYTKLNGRASGILYIGKWNDGIVVSKS